MEVLLVLSVVCASIAWTWWAFFKGRVTVEVASKGKVKTTRAYPPPRSGGSRWAVTVLQEEWQHILIDTRGRHWEVTQAAYDRAEVGARIRLRQWVDEWRPSQ